MSSTNDKDAEGRGLLFLLTWETKDEWFPAVEDYAEGEGRDYCLKYTLEEYAHVAEADYNMEGTPIFTNKPVLDAAGRPTDKYKVSHYVLKDKEKEYNKDNAWLRVRTNKYISETDKTTLTSEGLTSMKARISRLKQKYYRKTGSAGGKQIAKVAAFKYDILLSVEDNWSVIRKENRLASQFMDAPFDDKLLYTFFQSSLPSIFANTVESLNTHIHISVAEKLEILQDFWLGLSDAEKSKSAKAHLSAETALVAYDSDNSSGNESTRGKCFNCLSDEHGAKQCPYKLEGRRFMEQLRLRDEKKYGKDKMKALEDSPAMKSDNWRSRSSSRGRSPGRSTSRSRKLKKVVSALLSMADSDTDGTDGTYLTEDDDDSLLEVSHHTAENRKALPAPAGGK